MWFFGTKWPQNHVEQNLNQQITSLLSTGGQLHGTVLITFMVGSLIKLTLSAKYKVLSLYFLTESHKSNIPIIIGINEKTHFKLNVNLKQCSSKNDTHQGKYKIFIS